MKKLNKRLTLNKETIASLNNEQMGAVKGGQEDAAALTSIGHACSARHHCCRTLPTG